MPQPVNINMYLNRFINLCCKFKTELPDEIIAINNLGEILIYCKESKIYKPFGHIDKQECNGCKKVRDYLV